MDVVIKDTGIWQQYTPDTPPAIPGLPADAAFPPGVQFSRNSEGEDWYVFRASWPKNTLCAMAWPQNPGDPNSYCEIQSVVWSAADSPVPFGCRVLQITGWDSSDATPWKGWQFKFFDPNTGLISNPVNRVRVITSKADIWRRMTTDEATVIYADLQDADVKMRATFEAAQYIDHSDDLFPILMGAITQRCGAARAAEILAPS